MRTAANEMTPVGVCSRVVCSFISCTTLGCALTVGVKWQTVKWKQTVWESPWCENLTNISQHCEQTEASLLHSFPLTGALSPTSLPLPHTFILPSSFSFTDVYLLCLWQQAVFAERLSPHRRHCPAHQPLLTFDLDNSTCPLTHTLHTSCSVSFVHLWRQAPFSAAD